MTWFKVDDTFHAHPKARRAGLEALGLWTVAASWCSDQLTNGHVEPWFVDSWPRSKKAADLLVSAGLWHVPGHDCPECPKIEDGWQYHQWAERNPLKAQVLAERAAAAERQKRAREKAKAKRDGDRDIESSHTGSHAVTNSVTPPVSHGPPDPTRPVSTSVVTSRGDLTKADARAQNAPPETKGPRNPGRPADRCDRHAKMADPPNCGACADARKTAANWRADAPSDRPAAVVLASMPELDPTRNSARAAAIRDSLGRRAAS